METKRLQTIRCRMATSERSQFIMVNMLSYGNSCMESMYMHQKSFDIDMAIAV